MWTSRHVPRVLTHDGPQGVVRMWAVQWEEDAGGDAAKQLLRKGPGDSGECDREGGGRGLWWWRMGVFVGR